MGASGGTSGLASAWQAILAAASSMPSSDGWSWRLMDDGA